VAQQSVTKIIKVIIINLVTHKAVDMVELLFDKPASGYSCDKKPMFCEFQPRFESELTHVVEFADHTCSTSNQTLCLVKITTIFLECVKKSI